MHSSFPKPLYNVLPVGGAPHDHSSQFLTHHRTDTEGLLSSSSSSSNHLHCTVASLTPLSEPSMSQITTSSGEVSMDSPASSCVSSDAEVEMPMVVAGCPQCLMYMMLSDSEEEKQPKCPRCKSPVLLHFHKYCDTKNKT
ncbi:hypothetical protein ZWY2020_003210 [Hordeum vulgare]|uniref:GIR1-like zinc ribbon domain-containing protein n=1 Tax=Hordeum vulgare subsp. vulgare TaxID=112509 RepID=A0A8I7BEQ5_HORVV|nr:hypothetical protein ZWY2020_003210 [Hordeum vulgare]